MVHEVVAGGFGQELGGLATQLNSVGISVDTSKPVSAALPVDPDLLLQFVGGVGGAVTAETVHRTAAVVLEWFKSRRKDQKHPMMLGSDDDEDVVEGKKRDRTQVAIYGPRGELLKLVTVPR